MVTTPVDSASRLTFPDASTVAPSMWALVALMTLLLAMEAPIAMFPAPARAPEAAVTMERSRACRATSSAITHALFEICASTSFTTTFTETAPPNAKVPAPAPPMLTLLTTALEVASSPTSPRSEETSASSIYANMSFTTTLVATPAPMAAFPAPAMPPATAVTTEVSMAIAPMSPVASTSAPFEM